MRLAARFKDMSIRRKLTFITLLSTGAALLLAMVIATFYQWFVSHAELARITHSQAMIIASNSRSALRFNDPATAAENLAALNAFDNIEFAVLYDQDGRPFASFVVSGHEPPPVWVLPQEEHSHTHAALDRHAHTHAQHSFTAKQLDVIHAIDVDGERIGTIHLRSNLAPAYQEMIWNAGVMALATLAGMGIALLLIAYLHPAITGPIASLVGLMGAVSSKKNYALRVDARGKDELAALANGFNKMLEKIQARDNALAQQQAHLEQEVVRRTASLNEAQRVAHLGSWEWDVVNDTLSWSDEIYRIFGLAPQQFEATYEAFMRFVHPEDRQPVAESVRRALDQGQLYSQDHRIQLADGTMRHVHEQGEVSFDENGRAIRMVGTVHDITEAVLATEQIRKQQELTTQIIETIPMRVFWKDRDLHYLGSNTRFAKDAGFASPDELIDKTDFDMGWKDQADLYRADDRLVMDSNAPKLSYDEPQTTPDGNTIWLRSSKVPLHNELDETIGLLGVYEDITERKLSEQALEESERKFRAILDSAVDGILMADAQTQKFVTANRAICDMLGYRQEELYQLGVEDIHPAEALADIQRQFDRQMTQEIQVASNLPVKRKDGSILLADVSSSPLVLSGRHYLVGIFHDVTERNRVEERIRESEARYRNIFEYADDIIFLVSQDGTFRSINPAIERIMGWRAEEWIGKSFASLVHAEDLEDANAAFQKALSGESITSLRLRIARKSGEYFGADLSATYLGNGVVMGIARDVTERQRAEAEIRKLNEELEAKVQERTRQLLEAQEDLVRKEKLAVLGQVAGSVGHELRNPLGVMSNAVYFLQTVLADADQTTREYLGIIKEEIDDSERIVSDLLDSVRTKPPHPETVGVGELIGQVLHKYVFPSSVKVKLQLPETLSPLQVDPQQIQQVFRNLIGNAVEAMPDGGALDIRAEEQEPEGCIDISVQDTGSGIAPEIQSRLFQPLFTTKARGIGLGLVVVKNLTEANGGTLRVQSEVGQGTTFTVTLPTARSPARED